MFVKVKKKLILCKKKKLLNPFNYPRLLGIQGQNQDSGHVLNPDPQQSQPTYDHQVTKCMIQLQSCDLYYVVKEHFSYNAVCTVS